MFFDKVPVRAVWDDETSEWWFCAMDIAEALSKSQNPRIYWALLKRRHSELFTICKQLKLRASDGKAYNTDVVNESGVNTVIALIPSKKSTAFLNWMKNMGTTVDEKSKLKAFLICKVTEDDLELSKCCDCRFVPTFPLYAVLGIKLKS